MRFNSFIEQCHSIKFLYDQPHESEQEEDLEEQQIRLAKLRTSSIEITQFLLPDHFLSIQRITEKLQLDSQPRVYVINDPVLNAQVCTDHEHQEAVIICNSGLINLLEILEFDFVLGHELGHYGLSHSSRDMKDLNPVELIHELRRNRSAELSCDRVGLLATQSLNAATSVMIKMASGLKGPFLPQVTNNIVEALYEAKSNLQATKMDVWETHPAVAVRIWALHLFAGSQQYLETSGSGGTGHSLDQVNREIANSIFSSSEDDSFMQTERHIDLAISWIGALIIIDDEEIDQHEIDALNSIVGSELGTKIINYCKTNPYESVHEKAEASINRILDISSLEKQNLKIALRRMTNLLNIDFERTEDSRWKSLIERYFNF